MSVMSRLTPFWACFMGFLQPLQFLSAFSGNLRGTPLNTGVRSVPGSRLVRTPPRIPTPAPGA